MSSIKKVGGGVTAPQGFLAAGIHAGIKKRGALDLALILSEKPGSIAGMFTTNRIVAAPVILGRRQMAGGTGRAILINSGNANACTGQRGLVDAERLIARTARALDADPQWVFMSSTGVIGQPLPAQRIAAAIPRLVSALSRRGGEHAARAILTTDKKPKQAAASARIAGRLITVGGMAKGSGMIHPNMATMLAFVTTDAAIGQAALQGALRTAVAGSFNRISVDGDTSTNDTILCLANGSAGNTRLTADSAGLRVFQEVLNEVCLSLALQICRDGEGVTKLVEILVTGARTQRDATKTTHAIGTSCLVKTALYGEDANWGRIMAAIGRSGAAIQPSRISVSIDGIPIVKEGAGLGAQAERRIARAVRQPTFRILVDLGQGSGRASMWTTDLSHQYVTINASYRS